MKRILAAIALVLAVSPASAFAYSQVLNTNYTWSDGHTYDYVSWVYFGDIYIGTKSGLEDWASWEHILPAELSDPFYKVTRAKFWIDAEYVDDNDNPLDIQGVSAYLNNTGSDDTTVNLSSTLGDFGFWGNGSIGGSVHTDEYKLRLDRAKIVFDVAHCPDKEPNPVPDPATVILVGVGLGAGALRRFRKRG